MGVGPFSSSSDTKKTEQTISGNITASEGSTAFAVIAGKGSNVLPFGTLYKVAKGGSINLSVASPSSAGTVLANAIERQAAGAMGSEPANATPPDGFDKKTALVAAAVALVLLAVLWFSTRRQ